MLETIAEDEINTFSQVSIDLRPTLKEYFHQKSLTSVFIHHRVEKVNREYYSQDNQ